MSDSEMMDKIKKMQRERRLIENRDDKKNNKIGAL